MDTQGWSSCGEETELTLEGNSDYCMNVQMLAPKPLDWNPSCIQLFQNQLAS